MNHTPSKTSVIFFVITILSAIISFFNLIVVTRISYFTPILMVIDLFCMIFWIIKRETFMIVPIIAFLSQLFPIPSFYQKNQIFPQFDSSLNVVSYNVHQFYYNYTNSTPFIASILEQEKIDVVCFQEYTETDSMAIHQISSILPFSCIQDDTLGAKLAIFSKYPIINESKVLFKNNLNGAMCVDMEYLGKTIRIINCHLQTTGVSQNFKKGGDVMMEGVTDNSLIRSEQVDYLTRIIDDTSIPLILCGDFNDPAISHSYRMINRRLTDGFKQGGNGLEPTYIGGLKGLLRIDYIFHSDELLCTKYKSLEYKFSDHLPVESTLLLRE